MAVDEFAGNGAEMQEQWYAVQPERCGGWWIVSRDPAGEPGFDVDNSGDGGFTEERARLISATLELAAVARAYEAWEADLILNADWSNELPRMTQAQHDRLLEIQAMRNAALRKAGVTDNG